MHDPFSPSRRSTGPSLSVEEANALLGTQPVLVGKEELVIETGAVSSEELFEGRAKATDHYGLQDNSFSLKAIRYSHHRVAKLLAGGLPVVTVAAICNYHPTRVTMMKNSPAFQELVAHYTKEDQHDLADFIESAKSLSLDALHLLQERIDEHPEQFSPSMLVEVVKALADRSGNAPVNKTQNVNVHVDMGTKLRLARERAMEVDRSKLIEGQVLSSDAA